LTANSISVNKEKVTEVILLSKDLINHQFVLLQSGKKNYFVVSRLILTWFDCKIRLTDKQNKRINFIMNHQITTSNI
jgi:hypothetical protein